MATALDLQDLRRRLDTIDDGLHDLLIERAAVVALVAEHKSTHEIAFYQPGREAEIIQRLTQRHRGPLPVASLVRIWREIMAATLCLETPFTIAAYAPHGSPGVWDLARDHYGSNTPISAYGSIEDVIQAVADSPDRAGVLPMPQQDEPDPWWRRLLSPDRGIPHIVARLPFGPLGNARPAGAEALVIGHAALRNTGRDRTLIATETAGIGHARVLDLLPALDLGCTFFASCGQVDGGADLIELDGFVPLSDPRLARLRQQLGSALHRLLPLGGYAVPLAMAPAGATVSATAKA